MGLVLIGFWVITRGRKKGSSYHGYPKAPAGGGAFDPNDPNAAYTDATVGHDTSGSDSSTTTSYSKTTSSTDSASAESTFTSADLASTPTPPQQNGLGAVRSGATWGGIAMPSSPPSGNQSVNTLYHQDTTVLGGLIEGVVTRLSALI